MEWRDEAIVLGTRKHGETSAILEVMTRAHGRHLGLVQARELESFDRYLDRLCTRFEPHLELDVLRALATAPVITQTEAVHAMPPLGQRIAVADDVAFGFSYAATLLGWRAAGAEITWRRNGERQTHSIGGVPDRFQSSEDAERYIINLAKAWIDANP